MIPQLTIRTSARQFQMNDLGYECPYCHALYSPSIFVSEKIMKNDMKCNFCNKDWVEE